MFYYLINEVESYKTLEDFEKYLSSFLDGVLVSNGNDPCCLPNITGEAFINAEECIGDDEEGKQVLRKLLLSYYHLEDIDDEEQEKKVKEELMNKSIKEWPEEVREYIADSIINNGDRNLTDFDIAELIYSKDDSKQEAAICLLSHIMFEEDY